MRATLVIVNKLLKKSAKGGICNIFFSQAMQEAMVESKARRFFLYSGHDNTGTGLTQLI